MGMHHVRCYLVAKMAGQATSRRICSEFRVGDGSQPSMWRNRFRRCMTGITTAFCILKNCRMRATQLTRHDHGAIPASVHQHQYEPEGDNHHRLGNSTPPDTQIPGGPARRLLGGRAGAFSIRPWSIRARSTEYLGPSTQPAVTFAPRCATGLQSSGAMP